jgi:HPt (histidine-containing phosphotransfer) domain-containing protein
MADFVGKPIDARELDAVLSRVPSRIGDRAPALLAPLSGVLSPSALEKLRELETFGEAGFVAGLCRDFIADTKERLLRMEKAHESGAAKELEREAHGLKSASASLGADAMSKIAATLEQKARDGALSDAAERLQALSSEFVLVEAALLREIEKG